jgi:hypothetical protein
VSPRIRHRGGADERDQALPRAPRGAHGGLGGRHTARRGSRRRHRRRGNRWQRDRGTGGPRHCFRRAALGRERARRGHPSSCRHPSGPGARDDNRGSARPRRPRAYGSCGPPASANPWNNSSSPSVGRRARRC